MANPRTFLNGITDPRSAALGKIHTSDASGNATWTSGSVSALFPKEIAGTAYVTAGNPQGWAGADVGAWINAAWAYLVAQYPNQGGEIKVGPGAFNFTTPIVIGQQFYAMALRGSGCSSGANDVTKTAGTSLNYTATSGTALTFGGGDNNTGNVVMSNFSLNGTAIGNGATAMQYTNATTGSSSGSTLQDIAINAFTNGIVWQNSSLSYALTLLNCKIQFCTTGLTPQGENNVMIGGLVGGCGTGIAANTASVGVEIACTNVAFDDNTTTAINVGTALARTTVTGCRFENPSAGTDTYITLSAGSITVLGGAMQSDIVAVGTSTGFVQATGGYFYLYGTWMFNSSANRTFTQLFNVSSAVTSFKADPVIVTTSGAFTAGQQLFNIAAGVLPRAAVWCPQANPAGTVSIGTAATQCDTRGGLPLPAAVRPGTRVRASIVLTCTTATTGRVFTVSAHYGTANTSADATIYSSALTAGTTTAGSMIIYWDIYFLTATTAMAFVTTQLGATTNSISTANQDLGTAAPATIATTSASFLGFYILGTTAAIATVHSVSYEIVSN